MLRYWFLLFGVERPDEVPRLLHNCVVASHADRLEDIKHVMFRLNQPVEGLSVIIELNNFGGTPREGGYHAELEKMRQSTTVVVLEPGVGWLGRVSCFDPFLDGRCCVRGETKLTVDSSDLLKIVEKVILKPVEMS